MKTHSYGIGQNLDTREYTVYIDGQAVASYPFLRSALAHVDVHRSQEESGFEEGAIAVGTVTRFNQRQQDKRRVS